MIHMVKELLLVKMYVLDFASDVSKFLKNIQSWFYDNYTNPLLWLCIIFAIVAIFRIAYNALHGRD